MEEADDWGMMKLHNDYSWRKDNWTDDDPKPAYHYSEHEFPEWLKEIMQDA